MLGLKLIHVSKGGPWSIEKYNAIRYDNIFQLFISFLHEGSIEEDNLSR